MNKLKLLYNSNKLQKYGKTEKFLWQNLMQVKLLTKKIRFYLHKNFY